MSASVGEARHHFVSLGHQVYKLIVKVGEGRVDGGHVVLKTFDSPNGDAQRPQKLHFRRNQFVGCLQVPRVPAVFRVTADDVFIRL